MSGISIRIPGNPVAKGRPRFTWTPELISQFCTMWSDGVPADQIARILDTSEASIFNKASKLRRSGSDAFPSRERRPYKSSVRPNLRRVSDEALLSAYSELKSVKKVGSKLGINGASAHERLVKLKATSPVNKITPGERAIIRAYYQQTPDADFSLKALASTIGRTPSLVCRTAWEMGLTDEGRAKSDVAHAKIVERTKGITYSRGKAGYRDDLPGVHFRSKWEANYARYLNLLQGMGLVESWEFEPETFWFHKIKRGVRSYLPDFRVQYKHAAAPTFVEVKGWMDARSKTKIARFRRYYPEQTLEVVARAQYLDIKHKWSSAIPGWE